MVTAPRSKQVVSAGGVVYQHRDASIEVVICGRPRVGLWALPKGSPVGGETLQGTALREVQEETGLTVQIEASIGEIKYEFSGPDRVRYDKRVEHYLMKPVGGSIEEHDGEFDVVRWVSVEEALRLLRYQNERDILSEAVRLIRERGPR